LSRGGFQVIGRVNVKEKEPSPVNSQSSSAYREKDRQRSQVLGISIIALVTLLLAAIRYYFSLG
jgi:hypothetical protein